MKHGESGLLAMLRLDIWQRGSDLDASTLRPDANEMHAGVNFRTVLPDEFRSASRTPKEDFFPWVDL